MGKTKLASIDDSQAPLEVKRQKLKGPLRSEASKNTDQNNTPLLRRPKVEKLESEAGDAEEGSRRMPAGNEVTEDIRREAEAAGPESKSSEKKKAKSSKASQKKGNVKYRSLKYKQAAEKIEKGKRYPVTEAIDLAKQSSYSKFDGSLEIHLGTNAKNIRGLVSLPFASGKKLKILAFGPPSLKVSEGQAPFGEDIEIGNDDKLNEIIRGITNFDVIVTTPEWMPKLARAAKVLGPRGLMPSPKNGTITNDLKKAVTEIQSGKVEYKTEKNGQAIHLTLGKVSQKTDEVIANIKILFNAIGKTRIRKAVVAPSMGIGVKIDLASI
ncbi:50S ribosomal protein L1 [Candidatus Daviesbacteria bacterium]|nr:50S ribosomal protein L1 [Candidatus Daviesbacteria bacterium]